MKKVFNIIVFFSISAVAGISQNGMLLATPPTYNGLEPDDVSGLLAWWKSDAGVKELDGTTPEQGDVAVEWEDQSGNGYTLTIAGTSVYNTKDVRFNRYPSVGLTNNNTYAYNSSITGANFTSGFTAFIVMLDRRNETQDNGVMGCWDGVTGNKRTWLIVDDEISGEPTNIMLTDANGIAGDAVSSSGLFNVDETYVYMFQWDGVNQTIEQNGVTQDTDAAGSIYSGAARFEVNTYNNGSSTSVNSLVITEIILFTPEISSSDASAILDYLNFKYLTF